MSGETIYRIWKYWLYSFIGIGVFVSILLLVNINIPKPILITFAIYGGSWAMATLASLFYGAINIWLGPWK